MIATDTAFRFGDWQVCPDANRIERGAHVRRLEPRAMDVLVALCKANGRIVHPDELLLQCWGSTDGGDNTVHKALTQLRQALGDQATAPVYIETIRKRGYRTLAAVSFEGSLAEPASAAAHQSPFRGLEAFHEEHAKVFFGREEVTRRIVAAAERQVTAGWALLLLLGPSGSGKTSVVRAGVLPALAWPERRSGLRLLASTTLDLADLGEQSLFTAVAGALLDLEWQGEAVFHGDSAVSLGFRLEHRLDGVLARMRDVLAGPLEAAGPCRFGLFVDRLEAVAEDGAVGDAERQSFLALIERLATSGAVLVIMACRNDYYPFVVRIPILMRGKDQGGHVDLEPPGFTGIAHIVRMSARVAGLRFGADPVSHARLDDVLCESALGSPDALPLLQYCLGELYQLRSADGELGFDAFARVGGLEGAIAQRAEQLVMGFSEEQKAALPRIMSLVAVVHRGGGSAVSRRAPWSALRDAAQRHVVAAFVESRLFVSDLLGDAPGFGVAHEAILRHWPRMRDWVETHRGELLVRGRLAEWAERWKQEGYRKDFLLPAGKQLDEVAALRCSGLFDLGADEDRLICDSARRARRHEQLRLAAMFAILGLAAVAAILWFNAVAAQRLAEMRRAEAEGLMSYMLGDFAEKLRPLGRLELLDGISAKALEYLSRASTADDRAGQVQRAKSLQVIGEVERARGNLSAAMRALSEAHVILQRLAREAPRDTAVLRSLGDNAYWMGQISKDRSDFQKASAYWQVYLEVSDRLHAIEPANAVWWIEQSYAHNNLGSLAAIRGDPHTAVVEFGASIALKRRALDRTPDSTTVLAELADSYSWLASARAALGDLDAAAQLDEREMETVHRLRQLAPRDALWINRMVRALQHRATDRMVRGMDREALADLREAHALFAGILAQDPGNRAWKSELAFLELDEQGLVARTDGVDVQPKLSEILAVQLKLHENDPGNADWTRRLAFARLHVARASLLKGASAKAREENAAALAIFRSLFKDAPWNVKVRLGLANALLQQADIQAALGDERDRQATCAVAHGLLLAEAAASMNYQVLDPWARLSLCLGHADAADAALQRLRTIGYRDSVFLNSMTSPAKKGKT